MISVNDLGIYWWKPWLLTANDIGPVGAVMLWKVNSTTTVNLDGDWSNG